ncbi:amino acid-binding ACT protein [Nocardioidaceae bacterium]|nr:amino acid-binding ACT protein [Nocardioidaceae bacterium]
MADLVLTVLGEDRPGLVQAVSAPVEACGGSWQRSQLTRLAGKFAGVVLVSVPDDRVGELEAALPRLAEQGLEVRAEPAGGSEAHRGSAGEPRGATLRLQLLGDDRPGIVAEISAVLAARGVGIDEMETDVREAPMAGGMLFEIDATLSLPPAGDAADAEDVRAALEEVAGELMIDLTLTPPGPV